MTALATEVPFADLALQAVQGERDVAAADARQAAFLRFAETGIPGSKDEEWRFTSLRHLAAQTFTAPVAAAPLDERDLSPLLLLSNAVYRVVMVDGVMDLSLSRLPSRPGVRITAAAYTGAPAFLHDAATPFALLNAAIWRDGFAILVDEAVQLDAPIEVLHVATAAANGAVIAARNSIVARDRAAVTVVESFIAFGGAGYFTNAVCQVELGDGARVEHVRVQREASDASHIGATVVSQGRDSHYRSSTLAAGGRLARHNLHAHHRGSNVETLLYGLYLGRGEQLVDNHTAIYHDHPHCNSWEVYKGVLTDRARGVFNGKVFVKPEAQKTDAKQTNRNLLLSDHARVDTKPQLEIFADDVKCTHGATVGRLDEQQRYYLRTRGIAGREAEVLLISAFVAEVLTEIVHPGIRAAIERLVATEMQGMIA